MINILRKLRIGENFLNLVGDIFEKLTINLPINSERLYFNVSGYVFIAFVCLFVLFCFFLRFHLGEII